MKIIAVSYSSKSTHYRSSLSKTNLSLQHLIGLDSLKFIYLNNTLSEYDHQGLVHVKNWLITVIKTPQLIATSSEWYSYMIFSQSYLANQNQFPANCYTWEFHKFESKLLVPTCTIQCHSSYSITSHHLIARWH